MEEKIIKSYIDLLSQESYNTIFLKIRLEEVLQEKKELEERVKKLEEENKELQESLNERTRYDAMDE